jgi:hypothetical protein
MVSFVNKGEGRMTTTAIEPIKLAHKATWEAGDYAAIAELIDEIPPRDLLESVRVEPHQSVLDVATGTGTKTTGSTASSPSSAFSSLRATSTRRPSSSASASRVARSASSTGHRRVPSGGCSRS